MPSSRAAAAAVALVAALAGCGGDADDSADGEDGADLGESLAATLAATDAWADAYPLATGGAEVTTDDGTNVRLSVAGLGPDADYTAHLHDGGCAEDPPGGGHWLADPTGEDAAGNIIELSFTTNAQGAGSTDVSSGLALDDRAKSIVVHAPGPEVEAQRFDSDRMLCGDLTAV